MDPKNAQHADKAFRARVRVESHYCHPDYKLIVLDPAIANKSAHLELFCLEPLNSGLPRFVGRWDQGVLGRWRWRSGRRNNGVDVDIDVKHIIALSDGQRRQIGKKFKKSNDGYSGHWSTDNSGVLEIELTVSTNDFRQLLGHSRIFRGTVMLGEMVFEKHMVAKSGASVRLESSVRHWLPWFWR